MTLKGIGILLLVVLATVLLVKTDLFTRARVKATRILYGEQVRELKGVKIVVETSGADLDRAGITPAALTEALSSRLKDGGIRVLTEEEWRTSEGSPLLNVSVSATNLEGKRYQYMIVMEIHQKKGHKTGLFVTNEIAWSSSRSGTGSLEDVKRDIQKETDILLNTYSEKT